MSAVAQKKITLFDGELNRQTKHESHWSIVVIVDPLSLALTSISFNDLPLLYERMGGYSRKFWIGVCREGS